MAEAPTKRRSIRCRRSTRGQLYLENDEQMCEFIPKDLSDEDRLESLIKLCMKKAVDDTLANNPEAASVLDKSKIVSKMSESIEGLKSEGLLSRATASKKETNVATVVDEDMESNIKNAEDYISMMKNESKDWELLSEHYSNKTTSMRRKMENKKIVVSTPETNTEIEKKIAEEEEFCKTAEKNMKTIIKVDKKVDQFMEKVEQRISSHNRLLDAAYNTVLPTSVNKILFDKKL